MSFAITIEHRLNALHQLRLPGGSLEPLHGHDWHIEVTLARTDGGLDGCGFVADFHEIQRRLVLLLAPLEHANLSESPAFSGVNASAEQVAWWVAQNLETEPEVRVVGVDVEESPGCVAHWRRNP